MRGDPENANPIGTLPRTQIKIQAPAKDRQLLCGRWVGTCMVPPENWILILFEDCYYGERLEYTESNW